jgi:Ca2+-binding RTX toxin-like protein
MDVQDRGGSSMKKQIVSLVAALVLTATGVMSYSGAVHAASCVNGVNIAGNALNNVLTGGPENNIINGFGGNDALYGGGCNDHLFGGAGNDHIYGGDGNDVIDGGPGYDWCYGGPGVDVFVNCEVAVQ